jgi:hypothetical protein
MMRHVYVASAYQNALYVREHAHTELRKRGLVPTSSWAEEARHQFEDFDAHAPDYWRRVADRNELDIVTSDALILFSQDGMGGECFSEARWALMHRLPVLWFGRLTLGAFRTGVIRVPGLTDAIDWIVAHPNWVAE